MTPAIHYDANAEQYATIERGEYHFEKDGYVVAYDNLADEAGVEQKVTIPEERIVRIDG